MSSTKEEGLHHINAHRLLYICADVVLRDLFDVHGRAFDAVLTILVVRPIVMLSFIDPIWFVIFVVLVSELGMKLYILQGLCSDKGPFMDVNVGVLPYAAIMLLFVTVLPFCHSIVMWLPSSLAG